MTQMIQYLLLLGLFQALHASGNVEHKKKVGCENDPCDQQCVDTTDSFYCLCYKNWVLQTDQRTCIHEREEITNNIYIGCYAEETTERDFNYLLWSRDDASVEECIHSCRAEGFRYAALQNGRECHCSKSHRRIHGTSTGCNMPCSGAPGQNCGGSLANAVYKITRDNRYMGCYYENPSDQDLPTTAWDENTAASVDECVVYCSENGFLFAGVYNGGKCTCGNSYGRHGYAGEAFCMTTRCRHGWKEQNCGGSETNAIYRVVKGEYYGAQTIEMGKLASLEAEIISDYPHIKGVYTDRFAMYANDVIHADFEDSQCFSSDCYAPCADIAKPEGFDRYQTDLVVRKFHIYLHDLHNEIDSENPPNRVWLYAETVVINQDTVFDFSLSIRARQIIINYEVNPTITFNSEGVSLDMDIDKAIHEGSPSDLTFQKQSWLCVRILMSRPEDYYRRVGWSVFDNLARERSYNEEQRLWLDGLRSMKIDYTGAMMQAVNILPFVSKAGLESRLNIYYEQIELYDNSYAELLDDSTDCNTFHAMATNLLDIWINSMMNQAAIIGDMRTQALMISQGIYTRFYAEYSESRNELEVARENFEQGIMEWQDQQVREAMLGFISDCSEIVRGIYPVNPDATIEDILSTDASVTIDFMEAWGLCAENIAASMEAIEVMLAMVDEMMAGLGNANFDWSQYDGSVGEVAGLYAAIDEWQVLKNTVNVLLSDPTFSSISGCLEYQMTFLDTCNWGEELIKSAIEHAENLRRTIAADALYHNKQQMRDRLQAEIDALGGECSLRDQIVISFSEQHYDIIIDANDALILFCQAYFYETFVECPESAMPRFDGDLALLQLTLNNAYVIATSFARVSASRINIDIVDDPEANQACQDWVVCPISMFKRTRELIFNIPIDHRSFTGIDMFRVEEIEVSFTGIATDGPGTSVRVLVDVSGFFENKKGGITEAFITRPISSMIYEYDIVTGNILIICDLYAGNGNPSSNIQHMTPYVTWHFTIDPAWDHIILDDISSAQVSFIGPFLNGEKTIA